MIRVTANYLDGEYQIFDLESSEQLAVGQKERTLIISVSPDPNAESWVIPFEALRNWNVTRFDNGGPSHLSMAHHEPYHLWQEGYGVCLVYGCNAPAPRRDEAGEQDDLGADYSLDEMEPIQLPDWLDEDDEPGPDAQAVSWLNGPILAEDKELGWKGSEAREHRILLNREDG